MSKAVEVGNKNNLTRTVKNYADSVVHQAGQAVAGGAKILQDRIVICFFFFFFLTFGDYVVPNTFSYTVDNFDDLDSDLILRAKETILMAKPERVL